MKHCTKVWVQREWPSIFCFFKAIPYWVIRLFFNHAVQMTNRWSCVINISIKIQEIFITLKIYISYPPHQSWLLSCIRLCTHWDNSVKSNLDLIAQDSFLRGGSIHVNRGQECLLVPGLMPICLYIWGCVCSFGLFILCNTVIYLCVHILICISTHIYLFINKPAFVCITVCASWVWILYSRWQKSALASSVDVGSCVHMGLYFPSVLCALYLCIHIVIYWCPLAHEPFIFICCLSFNLAILRLDLTPPVSSIWVLRLQAPLPISLGGPFSSKPPHCLKASHKNPKQQMLWKY